MSTRLVARCLAVLLFGWSASSLLAVIATPMPLKSIYADATHIAAAKVESVDPARPSMKLVLTEDLNGAAPEREILVNLTGNPNGKPLPSSPRDVTDRVKADMQAVVFFVDSPSNPFALVYVEGSWYRIAKNSDGGKAWPYLYGEIYLRRTFKGTTAELKQALLDIKAGKPSPAYDTSEKPGLGPALPGVTAAPLLVAAKDAKDAKVEVPVAPAKDSAAALKDKAAAKDAPAKDAKPAAKSDDGGISKIVGGIVIVAGIALLVYVFVIRKKIA